MSDIMTKHAFYLAGQRGEKGETGVKGEQGDRGFRGFQGEQGIQGISAYEVAVKEGFEGTETEWIASLKGDKGDQGIQGIQGLQGIQGARGLQGEKGDIGQGVEVINVFDTVDELPTDLTEDNFGDCYVVGDNLYIWGKNGWTNLGNITSRNVDEYIAMGKDVIATSITEKGVPTEKEDTYSNMAYNIRNIFDKRPIVTGSDAIMEDVNDKLYDVKTFNATLNQSKEPKFIKDYTHNMGDIKQIILDNEFEYLLSERTILLTRKTGEMVSLNYSNAHCFDVKEGKMCVGYNTSPIAKVRVMNTAIEVLKTIDVEGTIVNVKFDSTGRVVIATTNNIYIFDKDYNEVLKVITVPTLTNFAIDNKDNMYFLGDDKKLVMLTNKGVELKKWDLSELAHNITDLKVNKYGNLFMIGNQDTKCGVYRVSVKGIELIYSDDISGLSKLEIGENNILYIASGLNGKIIKVVPTDKTVWSIDLGLEFTNQTFYLHEIDNKSCELYTTSKEKYKCYKDEYEFIWKLDIVGIDGTVSNVGDESSGPTIPEGMEGLAIFKDGSEKGISGFTYSTSLNQSPLTKKNTITGASNVISKTIIKTDKEDNVYIGTIDGTIEKYDKDFNFKIRITKPNMKDFYIFNDILYLISGSSLQTYDLEGTFIKDLVPVIGDTKIVFIDDNNIITSNANEFTIRRDGTIYATVWRDEGIKNICYLNERIYFIDNSNMMRVYIIETKETLVKGSRICTGMKSVNNMLYFYYNKSVSGKLSTEVATMYEPHKNSNLIVFEIDGDTKSMLIDEYENIYIFTTFKLLKLNKYGFKFREFSTDQPGNNALLHNDYIVGFNGSSIDRYIDDTRYSNKLAILE